MLMPEGDPESSDFENVWILAQTQTCIPNFVSLARTDPEILRGYTFV